MDKRQLKAVAPRGVRGKVFNFRASEMRFPVFSGAIKSGLLAELVHLFFNHVFVIRFYVQFRGFDRTTPGSAPVNIICHMHVLNCPSCFMVVFSRKLSNYCKCQITISGGLPMKMPGRVGDTPLVGCGGYANTVAAASTTGHGESLMRTVLAWDVVRNVEDGLSPVLACEKSVNKMATSIQGVGGVIALNSNGEFGKAFSTDHIAWASVRECVVKFGLGDQADEQEVPF